MVNYSLGLTRTFSALADPSRLQILERLARGPASVSELAVGKRMSLPAVAKHLKALEHAGLVHSHKSGRVRTCRLSAAPMREAADWLSTYRKLWDSRLDNLARHLRRQGEKQ